MAIKVWNCFGLVGDAVRDLDAIDTASLTDNDRAITVESDELYIHVFDAAGTDAQNSPNVIRPADYSSDGVWKMASSPFDANSAPVGSIVPFIGGYFGSGGLSGFTNVIGDDASTINTLLNSSGWYVCDGTELNLAGSSIFNGSGRYLPDLSGDVFLMGDTSSGTFGGSSTMAHTHTTDIVSFTSGATTVSEAQMPAHTHTSYAHSGTTVGRATGGETDYPRNLQDTSSTGGGGSHTHSVNPASTTSSAASVTENRPKFMSCFYIMRAA